MDNRGKRTVVQWASGVVAVASNRQPASQQQLTVSQQKKQQKNTHNTQKHTSKRAKHKEGLCRTWSRPIINVSTNKRPSCTSRNRTHTTHRTFWWSPKRQHKIRKSPHPPGFPLSFAKYLELRKTVGTSVANWSIEPVKKPAVSYLQKRTNENGTTSVSSFST